MTKKNNRIVRKTRRSNGDGSIYQIKNGRWSGKLSYKNEEGEPKRKSFYGQSKAEVSKKMTEFSGRMEGYNSISIKFKNIGELMEEWLLVFKRPSVTARTFEGIMRTFRLHIKPFIGNMKLEEVDSNVIQRRLNDMLAQEYSLLFVKKTKFILNQFFEYCIDNKIVENNPSTRTKVKSRDQKISDRENIYKAMSTEVRMEFMEKVNKHPFLKALCLTGLFSGLRIAEILALRWKNVDLLNKVIHVEHAITTVPVFDDKGNVIKRITVIGDTKTACSVRDVPIPNTLVEVLKEWKQRQWGEGQLRKQDFITDTSLVFGNYDGSVRCYYGTRSIFERFKTSNNMQKYNISFHTLRHTYASILFEGGENPKIIQALLGHKSVNTTLMVYNNVDKKYFLEASSRLNKIFDEKHMDAYKAFQNKTITKDMEEAEDLKIKNERVFDNEDQEILMLEKLLAERKEIINQKKIANTGI
jgi:integrase